MRMRVSGKEERSKSMKESEWRGAPPPTRLVSRGVCVLHVPPGDPQQVILVSPGLWGVYLHWAGRRSVYCPGVAHGCMRCSPTNQPAWYGYATGILRATGQARLVEVSAAAYHHCPGLAEADGHLTGRLAEVSRIGDNKTSGLRIRLVDGLYPRALPQLPEVRVLLSTLLGVSL
jgi:hypothetical protein